jgi:DNA-binding LacI/PurR family transcriptional regulator
VKVTLKDIAEETGYSISTVSRVLNGSGKISSQTAEEIHEAAKRLHYPTIKMQNNKNIRRSLDIVFIALEFSLGEFYSSLYSGLTQAALQSNINLSFVNLPLPLEQTKEKLKHMDEIDDYDGIIIFAPEFEMKDYRSLLEVLPERTPIISNTLIENPVVSTVTFDAYSGGFLASEHFIERGYKKCGIIKGPLEKSEARYRYNGFRDSLAQHADFDLVWSSQGDYSFRSGKHAFQDFEEAEVRPRAVFASNDNMAHAFLEAAIAQGYKIPEDVAVVGYDDVPICGRHRPSISSIRTDFEKLGMLTIEKLRLMILNQTEQEGILSFVPVTVKVRESS